MRKPAERLTGRAGRRSAAWLAAYGPRALVVGASKGIGAAFAEILAARGLDLTLVARNRKDLAAFSRAIAARFGVNVVSIALDVSKPRAAETLAREIRKTEIGLLVYNAALSPIGPFLSLSAAEHEAVLRANCRGPLLLARAAAERMKKRGRGGIVLVSSFSGLQGGPWFAAYAASKAYLITLAESLREELKGTGVAVIAPIAGAVGTPTYRSGLKGRKSAVPVMSPERAARLSLASLGRRGSAVLGAFNRFAAFVLGRFLGRGARAKIMGKIMRTRG